MKKVYVLAIVLGIVPALVWAEEDQRQAEKVPVMDEVVVTATKTREKRKDVASSVMLYDEYDIEESTAESVGEFLANEAGIDLRTRGNYGGASEEIHIRGMAADGTQVMVNGIVYNSPSLGASDVSQIPLNSIARIEVVKGPGSVLYGSGAMGGTVSIITKRPERDSISAAVQAGYGTESAYRLSAEQGMFAVGDLGYYVTVSRKETDGFRDNSDLEHTDLSLNLVLDKGEALDVSFYSDYVDREYGIPGPKPPAGTMDYFIGGTKFYNSESSSLVNRGSDENYHSALDVKSRVADLLDLHLRSDYSIQESTNLTRYPWGGFGDNTEVTNTIFGVEGNVSAAPFAWLKMIAGTEYRDFDYENTQQSLDSTGAPIPGFVSEAEHKVFTQGTFAEVNVLPVDWLKLVAGLRYEDHSRFGGESVGRFGLVANPLDNTTFKVNHGKHFKAPTMNDLFWPDDGFAKGNPDLQPETGWHTDFTIEQQLTAYKLFVAASYFTWDISDKIDWAEDPAQPTIIPGWNYWTPANINSYEADGVELNAAVGPYYGFTFNLDYTYQEVEEQLSGGVARQARYKPENLFKASLIHAADFGLITTVTTRYVGERPGYYALLTDTEPEQKLDGYWTFDVQLEQELTENWRVTLLASNIFDEDYATYLASFTDQNTFMTTQQPYPGAGQAFFASVTYEF